MMRAIVTSLYTLCAAAMLMLAPAVVRADHSPGNLVADGIEIYYAVLPAEMIRDYPKGSPERRMHGGVPRGPHNHHVMVALFDAKSFERITDAEVTATVAETGMPATTEPLEAMAAVDALTYGNYFHFSALAHYQITIAIRRAGSDKVIRASFGYQHH